MPTSPLTSLRQRAAPTSPLPAAPLPTTAHAATSPATFTASMAEIISRANDVATSPHPGAAVAHAATSPLPQPGSPVAMGASTQHLLEAEVEQARERLAEVEKELAVAKGTATRHADERRKMMKSLADSRTETAAWRQKVLAKKAPPPKPAAKADVTKPAFPVAAERKLRIKARTAALRASLRASNFGQLRLRLAARAARWPVALLRRRESPKPEPSPKKEWGKPSPSAPSRLNPIPVRSALKPPSARRTPAAASRTPAASDARHRTRRRRAAAGAADCVAARRARITGRASDCFTNSSLIGRRRRPPVVPLRAAPCVRQLARRDASAAVGAAVVAVADAAVALTAAAVPLTALAAAVAAGGEHAAAAKAPPEAGPSNCPLVSQRSTLAPTSRRSSRCLLRRRRAPERRRGR